MHEWYGIIGGSDKLRPMPGISKIGYIDHIGGNPKDPLTLGFMRARTLVDKVGPWRLDRPPPAGIQGWVEGERCHRCSYLFQRQVLAADKDHQCVFTSAGLKEYNKQHKIEVAQVETKLDAKDDEPQEEPVGAVSARKPAAAAPPSRDRVYKHSEDQTFEVEAIVDSKIVIDPDNSKRVLYLTKWKGYGPEDDSWEPVESFKSAKAVLTAYMASPQHKQKMDQQSKRGAGEVSASVKDGR